MTIIGMLYRRKDPDTVRKAYACAAVAKMEGSMFYYFTLNNVKLDPEYIIGHIHENGEWIERHFPFPDVIYNACSPRNRSERKIYRELKKKIPFTSHPIGNKFSVYKRMQNSGKFEDVLIPSHEVSKGHEVMEYIFEYESVVIKPKKGSKGKEIMFVEQKPESLLLTENSKTEEVSIEEANKRIQKRLSTRSYILQPYIHCKTKNGNPFDFRIHIQKNGTGVWSINEIYPRIGKREGIVSNIHSGGYRTSLFDFLKEEYPITYQRIYRSLESLALEFPMNFEKLYECQFDELGIDVGLQNGNQLKLFEVNWRPGCRNRELETAKYLIDYAMYLAKNKI
ncbi:YheC/YheD family protein [Bacillus sp. DJP31]|uniref:YheC/YheD family endospore coat-associated protein n=1 Tax=Bacillus sp. DJP31 TaxID=3409789 RepID=UPI003BB7AEEA